MSSDLDSQLATMTGARQTMLSWAKVIESYEAVPEVFKSSYKTILGDEPQFPYVVYAPSITGIRHKTMEKMLCQVNDTIHVWERIDNRVTAVAYPLAGVSDLEMGSILLYSWITISGVTLAGTASTSVIEFNTATRRHFARFVEQLRPAPNDLDASERGVEQAKFDYLALENFKFMNYAIESLSGSEKVIQAIWQRSIDRPVFLLGLHISQRNLALSHLVILTDKELIVIQDDERSQENRGARYGGKWHYIALNHIESVSVLDQADDLLALSLTLSPTGRKLEIVFEASQRRELTQLQSELEKRMG